MNTTVILPSLDPDDKMPKVVKHLIEAGFKDMILVNDGSHEENLKYFDEAIAMAEGTDATVTLLTHEVNKGKGRAMKTAFAWCLENRPDIAGVITVDGDGQHQIDDIIKVASAMEQEPDKLWLGVRDFNQPDVPPRSKFGNKWTIGILRVTCGVKVSDSQTGLRAFSRDLLPFLLEVQGERYEYETQMLLDAKRCGIKFGEKVIKTIYIDENATSHYRPFRDSMKVLKIIFKYLLSSVLSTLVEFVLFSILNLVLANWLGDSVRLLVATFAARACSCMFNYTLNRNLVFKDKGSVGKSLVRYLALVVVQACCSYGLVYLLSTILKATPFWQIIIKIPVDTLLFLASYQIQLRWVFKK